MTVCASCLEESTYSALFSHVDTEHSYVALCVSEATVGLMPFFFLQVSLAELLFERGIIHTAEAL